MDSNSSVLAVAPFWDTPLPSGFHCCCWEFSDLRVQSFSLTFKVFVIPDLQFHYYVSGYIGLIYLVWFRWAWTFRLLLLIIQVKYWALISWSTSPAPSSLPFSKARLRLILGLFTFMLRDFHFCHLLCATFWTLLLTCLLSHWFALYLIVNFSQCVLFPQILNNHFFKSCHLKYFLFPVNIFKFYLNLKNMLFCSISTSVSEPLIFFFFFPIFTHGVHLVTLGAVHIP